MIRQRRADDHNWLCRIAHVCSLAWDWVDRRQVFERFIAVVVLYGTVIITRWAMDYAESHDEKSGTDAAAIIVSVLAPYMALQAAAIGFMFKAKTP